jgi:hypothetical protein
VSDSLTKPLLGALPDILPHTCVVEPVRINKFAECNYETNRYSVPTRYAHRDAFIEVYEEKIRVIVGADVVPEHRRHFGKTAAIWTFGITSSSLRESIGLRKRRSYFLMRRFQWRSVSYSKDTGHRKTQLQRNVGQKCSCFSIIGLRSGSSWIGLRDTHSQFVLRYEADRA